ncbi:Serine/Threonine protein kinase with repeats [Candidatus Thiomargarita nelsonii]|uniref:Serine/Threonine protein kinase with repeats n=1 Tax=Candidatus Thiomargarita nelsonii TaxID=1003181 RepID=A0A176RTD2_9GAMM|nr:Serine/Threonine protein kinase with repeats [Candidatus Thiomargarita nelsonii]
MVSLPHQKNGLKWRKGHQTPVLSVAFSQDGGILISGSDDNTIKIWEVSTGSLLYTLQKERMWVNSISFSPDGRTLASTDDAFIRLRELRTGKVLLESCGLNTVTFSPDGRTLVAGSVNNTVKLWDVKTGKEIRTLKRHTKYVRSLSFSPDGRTLASGSDDNTIKLWDVSTGKMLATLEGHWHSVCFLVFHPNGQMLASGSCDKTIKLWDVNSHKGLATLQGHDCMVKSLAFCPAGGTLVSASEDKTIKVWQ